MSRWRCAALPPRPITGYSSDHAAVGPGIVHKPSDRGLLRTAVLDVDDAIQHECRGDGERAGVDPVFAGEGDLLTGFVPDLRVHVGVGAGASVAGAFALAGHHWVNAGTFAVAAALVLYRVVDVEYRGAD